MLLYFLLRSGEAWDSEEWLRDSLLPQPALRRPPSTSRGVAEGPVLRPTLWWGRRTGVLLAWVASGVVVALVGVGQWIGGALVQAGGVGRVTGVYYSPNHLALYLERMWPLVLAGALHGGLARRCRLAAWGGVAVLGLGLYLTYSRAAWLLAVPLALLVIGVAYRADRSQADRGSARRRWSTGALALAVLLAAGSVLLGRSTPLSTLLDEVRIPVWQSTLEMIADHPWGGVGLDGFRFVYPRYMRVEAWTEPLLYHPHNMWLDAAVRLGLPGLAVFAVLVAWIVREVRAFGARKEALHDRGPCDWGDARTHKAVAVGCLAGVCAGLAHGLVDSGYFVVDLAWTLALVAGLLSRPPLRRIGMRLLRISQPCNSPRRVDVGHC
jgi:O-antigen ligase